MWIIRECEHLMCHVFVSLVSKGLTINLSGSTVWSSLKIVWYVRDSKVIFCTYFLYHLAGLNKWSYNSPIAPITPFGMFLLSKTAFGQPNFWIEWEDHSKGNLEWKLRVPDQAKGGQGPDIHSRFPSYSVTKYYTFSIY